MLVVLGIDFLPALMNTKDFMMVRDNSFPGKFSGLEVDPG